MSSMIHTHAARFDTAPLAIGREAVRATRASILASTMSL